MRHCVLGSGAFVAVLSAVPAVDASVLSQWNFNTSLGGTVTQSSYSYAGEAGPYSGSFLVHTGFSGTDFTTPAGNGSAYGLSADKWSTGDYAEVTVNALPSYLNSFELSWDQTRSTFGPSEFRVDVSFNGGASFTTLANSDYSAILAGGIGTGTNAWSATGARQSQFTRSISFSGTASSGVLKVRLVATGANLGNGSARFDNVVLSGVPAPGAVALLGLAGLAGRRRNR